MRLLIVMFLGLLVCGAHVAARGTGDAAKGKLAYADRKCAMCHKTDKDATGGKMSILASTVGKLSAGELKSWLTDTAAMEAKLPKKPPVQMSGFMKGLKPPMGDAEVANLVGYLQTLPAKP